MREIQYREAIREAIIEEMDRDRKVFLIGEDVGVYGGAFKAYKGLLDKYGPDRVINTPISETAIIGAGIGTALTGYRPIVEIMFIDFATLAMDQIANQAAKIHFMSGGRLDVPLVIRTQGGVGKGLATQHSQSLEAWFYHIPGLKVVMPATSYDVKGLLKTAIRDNSPVMFIEHKMIYPVKGAVPLVPLDIDEVINSVKKTGRLIIVSEVCRRGSVASDISARVTERVFEYLKAPVKIVAGLDTPIPYNSTLERASIPQKSDIIKAAKELLEEIL